LDTILGKNRARSAAGAGVACRLAASYLLKHYQSARPTCPSAPRT